MAILTFRVKGQTLTVESKINKIVENSVNYLDYEIIYDDEKWDPPLAKKVVITYDKKTYEIFGDKIPSQVIHAPGFTVSVIGYKSDSEDDSGIIITTYPVAIKVFPSGAIKGTIPEDTAIDSSVAEQLNEKIENQVNDIKNNYLSKDLLRFLINENSTNLEVPTAKAVYDCVGTLKTEIMGDLDEIADLIGGDIQDSIYQNAFTMTMKTEELVQIGDTAWYMASVDYNGYLANNGIYRLTIDDTDPIFVTMQHYENAGLVCGNTAIVGGEDTGDDYSIIWNGAEISLLLKEMGTYTIKIDYIDNIPVLVDETVTFAVNNTLAQQGLTLPVSDVIQDVDNVYDLTEGDVCSISFNGSELKEYTVVKFNGTLFIGNLSIFYPSEENTGEHFLMAFDESDLIITNLPEGKYKVSMYKNFEG